MIMELTRFLLVVVLPFEKRLLEAAQQNFGKIRLIIKVMKTFTLLFLLMMSLSASADVTINLDAGQLTGPPTAPMVADDNSPSDNGSLLLIVDLGSSAGGDTASPLVTAGNFVAGGDTILAAGGFNDNGGTNETLTAFDVSGSVFASNNEGGTAKAGDDLALRWFPQITYAEYQAGTVTITGDFFGTYNPDGGNPYGGPGSSDWILSSDGSAVSLDFYTAAPLDVVSPGEAPFAAGVADSVILAAAVPEPSSSLLLVLGTLLLFLVSFWRRRNASIKV
jgi:hypothetical protein